MITITETARQKPTARWNYWSQPKEMRLPSEIVQPLYDGSLPMFS